MSRPTEQYLCVNAAFVKLPLQISRVNRTMVLENLDQLYLKGVSAGEGHTRTPQYVLMIKVPENHTIVHCSGPYYSIECVKIVALSVLRQLQWELVDGPTDRADFTFFEADDIEWHLEDADYEGRAEPYTIHIHEMSNPEED